ncbi:MAG TPA: hypothetical protein EYG40_10740 [Verrucomicrobia bacterium]|nr:hypothetical protein [Verrucomicrobiales bacterium]HIL55497.1 hypothetical protein [Verrucomicrobiota bacterium]
MKTLNAFALLVLLVSLPLLLGGCGEKVEVEPEAEVKPKENFTGSQRNQSFPDFSKILNGVEHLLFFF